MLQIKCFFNYFGGGMLKLKSITVKKITILNN